MVRVEVAAVNALRLKNQIRERKIVERLRFGAGPVATRLGQRIAPD